MTSSFDPKLLIGAARESEQGEHYTVVVSEENIIVGVGARCAESDECDLFIEVSLHLCQRGPGFDIRALEHIANLLHSLEKMGYDMGCEMGLITCEKALSPGEINEELASINALLTL